MLNYTDKIAFRLRKRTGLRKVSYHGFLYRAQRLEAQLRKHRSTLETKVLCSNNALIQAYAAMNNTFKQKLPEKRQIYNLDDFDMDAFMHSHHTEAQFADVEFQVRIEYNPQRPYELLYTANNLQTPDTEVLKDQQQPTLGFTAVRKTLFSSHNT